MITTIAGFQRLTAWAGLAWIAGWAWFCVLCGHPGWAFGGALILWAGYALALGFELVAMRFVSRRDPTPPATLGELLRAWWTEMTIAPRVFCWRQPFRTWAQPDHLPTDAGGRLGVVFVHGFICNRAMWNPWMARLRQSGVPFIAVNLEPVFGSIEHYAGIIDAAVRRVHDATGRPPLVVAHSMGGVAVRAWLQAFQADDRVDGVVTIATPHRGTWLARFSRRANGRQMALKGEWLAALAKAEPASRLARFTCFHTACDNVVFPPSSATLPGADNRLVRGGVAHLRLAFHDEVVSEVRRRVSASMPATSPAVQTR